MNNNQFFKMYINKIIKCRPNIFKLLKCRIKKNKTHLENKHCSM